jgi:hypothetical protein
MRYEPAGEGIARRKPVTTERNLKAPPPRPEDNEETFGSVIPSKDSTIVATPKRDRTPKGVNDGRGKRSVKDMIAEAPSHAHRATYVLERVAALEDQIARMLELCPPETREIIFSARKSLRHYFEK